MKKEYVTPQVREIAFETQDVILQSSLLKSGDFHAGGANSTEYEDSWNELSTSV